MFGIGPEKKTRFFHRALCVALLLFALIVVHQNVQAQGEDEVVRVEANLVQLNIGVTDSNGKPITDLTREDFLVFEDDVRQTVMSFEPTTAPFSLVMMLDTSGSTLPFRQTLKLAAWRFIDALAPEDRVSVVSFNTKTERLTNFTSDRKKIAYAIEIANGKGGTDLYRSLGFALEQLSNEGKRRKAIIVLTDGVDSELRNLDRIATAKARTQDEAIAAIKPGQSKSLQSVLDEAARQGVTIYPLALPSGDPKRIAEPTPHQVAAYRAARERIQVLADRTGGRLHVINRLEEMARLYAEVAADLRSLYTLAYQSSGEQRRSDGWRSIRIEIKRSQLIARTRPGYFLH